MQDAPSLLRTTMQITVQHVEHPTDTQIDEAVELLLRAFEGDVTIPAMTGGDTRLQQSLFRSLVRGGALSDAFYVVTDDSNEIFTIGVWARPGQKLFSSETERKSSGWDAFFASLSPETQKWWTETLPETHEKMMRSALGDSYNDRWQANILATHPKHQKKGYATAMIQAMCKRAKDDGKVIGLATHNAKNAAFYERLGFRILANTEIPAPVASWTEYALIWGDAEL
ncbi:hypothetical protein OF83DRAFT_502895 [Amylostereum chailletii]|nr:hypothetical protein OF83DRAFT_502895 [Amylostereum chailletii]